MHSITKFQTRQILTIFKSTRENPEDIFDSLFKNPAKKAQMFGEEIKVL